MVVHLTIKMSQYKKNATKLTEFQLHEGWIEISKNEKRTMKEYGTIALFNRILLIFFIYCY